MLPYTRIQNSLITLILMEELKNYKGVFYCDLRLCTLLIKHLLLEIYCDGFNRISTIHEHCYPMIR
jgi:hypothetical protein